MHAQQPSRPARIGWLGVAVDPPPAFLQRMRERGYEPGRALLVRADRVIE